MIFFIFFMTIFCTSQWTEPDPNPDPSYFESGSVLEKSNLCCWSGGGPPVTSSQVQSGGVRGGDTLPGTK